MRTLIQPIGSALTAGVLIVASACAGAPAPTSPTVAAVATAASSPIATAVAAASPAATAMASPAATAAAAASPAAATVVAAASPAMATAATAASPAAATAQAAASPAAATAVAAASPAATALAAASPVRITGTSLSPTDTTITVQNAGTSAVDMAGWRLRVGTASVTLPSGARVAPNETVTIHTAAGTGTASDIYLGQESATLVTGLRPGATVTLVDAQGAVVSEFRLPG